MTQKLLEGSLSATGMAWHLLRDTVLHPLSTTKIYTYEIIKEKGNGKREKKVRYVVKTLKE